MNQLPLKNLLTTLSCFLFFFAHGQKKFTSEVEEKGDTTFISTKTTFNGRLCETGNVRRFKSQELILREQILKRGIIPSDFSIDTLTNEQKFQRGIKYYKTEVDSPTKEQLFERGFMTSSRQGMQVIDSITLFSYDKDWNLIKKQVLRTKNEIGSQLGFQYSEDEFSVKTGQLRIEGRKNSTVPLIFSIKNLTPQNYIFKWEVVGEKISHQEEEVLPNRSTKAISLDISIKRGINNITFQAENSNQISQTIYLQTFGYDLLHADFVDKGEGEPNQVIELDASKEILIEFTENNKLLRVQTEEGLLRIPVSQLMNTVDLSQLEKGVYNLELVNLKTNGVKVCRVKLL